jgi:hypothetical protein
VWAAIRSYKDERKMDPETLNVIDKLSTVAILALLLYRENARTEKLLAQLIDQSKEYTNNLIKMALAGFDRRVDEEVQKQ